MLPINSTFLATWLWPFTERAIVLSVIMLLVIFVIVSDNFEWKWICAGFYNYICIVVGDPTIKIGRVGIPFTSLILPLFLCLSQTRTMISNLICHCLFHIQWFEMRSDSFFVVDIDGIIIVDHHCLNFYFIIKLFKKMIKKNKACLCCEIHPTNFHQYKWCSYHAMHVRISVFIANSSQFVPLFFFYFFYNGV